MNDLSGMTVGPYHLRELIGKGGMAGVYRAHQITVGRDVAIKVLSPDLADEAEFISRFEHEARIVAGLQHPHIVPIHDFGREGRMTYLVMRLMEGGSLDRELRGALLTKERVIQVVGQIASALDYAHGRGIVHRDLKPTNVLLDRARSAYLTDFGIAKLTTGGPATGLTVTGTVMGTPTYMAPEQWRSEPVDARTDVYALGVLIYQMLLGRVPFAADTVHGLMYQHLDADPPPPSRVRPDLPQVVEPVIRQALAKNPSRRYPSAGELAHQLENALMFRSQTMYAPLPPRPSTPNLRDLDDAILEDELLALDNDNRSRAPQPPRTVTPPPSQAMPTPMPAYQPPVYRTPPPSYPRREIRREPPHDIGILGHIQQFVGTIGLVIILIGLISAALLGALLLFAPGDQNADQEPTLPITPGATSVPADQRPSVVIQSPDNNSTVSLGEEVPIRFTARGQQGITRVELYRLNQKTNEVFASGDTTFSGEFSYPATDTGMHMLEVVPWSGNIRGDPARVTIIVQ